ncbi:MAG: flagellar motor switch protein FliG [Sphingomonadales bacterium]|nr:flagellar motor switch protein FliG [Sphingomonadales bacterium]
MTATPAPMADAEAAAVLLTLIGDEQAVALLARLEPPELQLLGEKMCALGDIEAEAIVAAIAGFLHRAESVGPATGNHAGRIEALMQRAVGDIKAQAMMQRIQPEAGPASAIELARWLNAPAIVPLVRAEHPQAIAVLLIQLVPEVAAEVLASLPAPEQTQVIHRIATMGPVSADALAMLDELLTRRIGAAHGSAMLAMGGPRQAADIINNAGKAAEKRLIPELARLDRQLARRIEEEMFKFEHLYVLDAQAMGILLRDVESDVLINALKGTEPAQREVFFRAMSSRAADGVRDEIAARGRLRLAEVTEAQRQMVATARRLAGDGAIQFGAGGGDDEYV